MKSLRKSIEKFYLSILIISLCSIALVLFFVVERLSINQIDRELEYFMADLIRYLEEPTKEPVALFGKRDVGFLVVEDGKTIASFQIPSDLIFQLVSFQEGFRFFSGYKVFVKPFEVYKVIIVKSTKQRNTMLLTLAFSLISTLVGVILLAMYFGSKLVEKLVKPIEDIGLQMDEVSKGLREKIEVQATSKEVFKLQTQINEALDRLKKTMEELRSFASYLSHQLRNPLASAKAQVEFLLSYQEHSQELESVLKNLNKMVRIIEGLLLLARIQHQKEGNFVQEDLSSILMESLEQLMQKFPHIEFELDIQPKVTFSCIKDLMEHVFTNLVENACKYCEGSNQVFVRLYKDDSTVIFKVENFGRAIPEEERNKIFERFFRGSKTKGEGLGLGLPIAKAIVELHKGQIRYYHDQGKNVFEVLFND
ncbi:HAMP domain-containing sensor histidine kinase [Pseudothermotoga thermarum]|uniref:histidine kinase n=1 Tax=Pseudothermotoga thermarum DSM 5069 TaxID=688269 RepID=F7YTP8_9THEM|nr:HAMP domain-containing sensor histidine kinase [Pseudothermotoga thermarum]AEH51270.1 integral membrane sensor signal transduction histidine kinase [Pseudothermotoga thermarum DSM 5069]